MDYVSETDPLSQRFSGRAHINAPSAERIRRRRGYAGGGVERFRWGGEDSRVHLLQLQEGAPLLREKSMAPLGCLVVPRYASKS